MQYSVKDFFRRTSQATLSNTLWKPKALYALFYASLTAWRMTTVSLVDRGFTPLQLGTVSSALAPFGWFSAFLWTSINDWARRPQLIVAACLFLSAVSAANFVMLRSSLALTLVSMTVFTFFFPSGSLICGIVLKYLPDKSDYGKQRFWAPASIAVTSLLIGTFWPDQGLKTSWWQSPKHLALNCPNNSPCILQPNASACQAHCLSLHQGCNAVQYHQTDRDCCPKLCLSIPWHTSSQQALESYLYMRPSHMLHARNMVCRGWYAKLQNVTHDKCAQQCMIEAKCLFFSVLPHDTCTLSMNGQCGSDMAPLTRAEVHRKLDTNRLQVYPVSVADPHPIPIAAASINCNVSRLTDTHDQRSGLHLDTFEERPHHTLCTATIILPAPAAISAVKLRNEHVSGAAMEWLTMHYGPGRMGSRPMVTRNAKESVNLSWQLSATIPWFNTSHSAFQLSPPLIAHSLMFVGLKDPVHGSIELFGDDAKLQSLVPKVEVPDPDDSSIDHIQWVTAGLLLALVFMMLTVSMAPAVVQPDQWCDETLQMSSLSSRLQDDRPHTEELEQKFADPLEYRQVTDVTLPTPTMPLPCRVIIWRVLCQPKFACFLGGATLLGFGHCTLDGFFVIHLRQMGNSVFVLGVASSVGTASELLFFWSSKWFLHRLGAQVMLALSMASYIVKAILYGFTAHGLPLILVAQMLHGPCFVLTWTALQHCLAHAVPLNTMSTVQQIFFSAFFAAPGLFSGMIGGALADWRGTATLFHLTAIYFTTLLILFLLAIWRCHKVLELPVVDLISPAQSASSLP